MNLLALILFSTAAGQDGRKLEWRKDYPAALQEGKKAGKYLIVHFSGPG